MVGFYFTRSLLLISLILGFIAVPRITMLICLLVERKDSLPSREPQVSKQVNRRLLIEDILELSIFFLIPRISMIIFYVCNAIRGTL